MRQPLAFLGSLAITLLMTWAGLHFDRALFDGGIILSVFVAVLWLWTWAKPKAPAAATGGQVIQIKSNPEAEAAKRRRDLADVIHIATRNAREAWADNPRVTTATEHARKLRALLLTLNKEKGIPLPQRTTNELMNYQGACQLLEIVHPLIALGHDEEAKAEAKRFVDAFNEKLSV